jgi:hypothetical protein
MLARPIVRVGAVVAAVVVAAAAWYLGSPLFIRTTADESLPTLRPPAVTAAPGTSATPIAVASADAATRVLARGELGYVDQLHNGKGPVTLVRVGTQVFTRFENVAITNAPDVHVYLSRETGGKWSESSSLYLGTLKATNGSFNYELPSGTDPAPYRSVVVWCRAFSVLITWADLTPA